MRDDPTDARHPTHQFVAVVQAERGGQRVLVLDLDPIHRPAHQQTQGVADVEQFVTRLGEPLVRAVGHPGGGHRLHHRQIAQSPAGLLQVGNGRIGQLAAAVGAHLAGRQQRR